MYAEALLEAARLALVAAREVHDAAAALAARVRHAASHRSLEEAAAAVAARDAIVLPAAHTASFQRLIDLLVSCNRTGAPATVLCSHRDRAECAGRARHKSQ